jgi:hypothetical protein
MCGPVSLAIVWFGHIHYPTASLALLIVFLQEVLPVLLEDLPLAVRRDMWFQHDGASAHFRAQTEQHLNTQFSDRWLGRGGPVS